MIETLRKFFKIIFHPQSPANVFRHPKRLFMYGLARILNFYLKMRSLKKTKNQVTCNICGWEGYKFGYNAGISGDFFSADQICLGCGSNRRTRILVDLFTQSIKLTNESMIIADIGAAKSTRKYFSQEPNIKYLTVDQYKGADVESNIVDITLPDNSMDGVLCCHVLEHIQDYEKGIAELYRIMKPGYFGIIAVPQTPGLTQTRRTGEQTYEGYGHIWEFGEDFAGHLEEAGFRVTTLHIPKNERDTQSIRWPYHVVQKPNPQM